MPNEPQLSSTSELLAKVTWPLFTERLVLRPTELEDLDTIFSYRSLPEVGRWTMRVEDDRDDFVKRWSEHHLPGRNLVIMRRPSDESSGAEEPVAQIIGDLYLHIEDGWSQVEVASQAKNVNAGIGWSLKPGNEGHGYATEASRALIDLCFRQLGVRRVYAEAFAANEPSLAVMRRLGMRQEALHRKESLHRDLGWQDGVMYAVLAEEWLA